MRLARYCSPAHSGHLSRNSRRRRCSNCMGPCRRLGVERSVSRVAALGILAAIAVAAALLLEMSSVRSCAAEDEPALKDFTDATLESLKISAVEPKKDDKTGFVVGGKNRSSMILGLAEINGRTISELESEMRPGALS